MYCIVLPSLVFLIHLQFLYLWLWVFFAQFLGLWPDWLTVWSTLLNIVVFTLIDNNCLGNIGSDPLHKEGLDGRPLSVVIISFLLKWFVFVCVEKQLFILSPLQIILRKLAFYCNYQLSSLHVSVCVSTSADWQGLRAHRRKKVSFKATALYGRLGVIYKHLVATPASGISAHNTGWGCQTLSHHTKEVTVRLRISIWKKQLRSTFSTLYQKETSYLRSSMLCFMSE